MDQLWGTALQLGIGGLSVAGIIYVSLKHSQTMRSMQESFIAEMGKRADKHESGMREREEALRAVERNVRETFAAQIMENTIALREVGKVLGRVVNQLDTRRT